MPTRLSLLFVVFVGISAWAQASPVSHPTARSAPTDSQAVYLPIVQAPVLRDWLGYVNYYRALARLPQVTENSAWSAGDRSHAKYIVKNDVLGHDEDAGNPWYTPEGLAAAQSSNLSASSDSGATDEWAINSWMQAPFHAVGILDPRLKQVGYGSYREVDGGFQMAAGLDVIRGLDNPPDPVIFPVKWPGEGMTVPLRLHDGEYPDPLTSCPGYQAPSGLPVILQLGPGDLTPLVTAHALMRGSTPIEHCVFDETNYANSDGAGRSLGRAILDSRDAIVLIPRAPLTAGATYTASITANAQTYTWSFTVSPSALERNLPGIRP